MKEAISQTLFRFVSLKNPEISEEHGQEKRFISPSQNATKGTFYSAVAAKGKNTSKWQALLNLAKDFKALSKEELKAVDSKHAYNMHIYEYGISIKDNLSIVDNDLPGNQYLVAQRQKELTDGQGLEVNLSSKAYSVISF